MEAKGVKRNTNQMECMVSFMESHPMLNDGTLNNAFTSHDRNKLWEKLAALLNAEGGAVKSVEKWQKSWSDAKSHVKKKYATLKTYTRKTGGGKRPAKTIVLSELEERILSLIGKDALEGLNVPEAKFPGQTESDSNLDSIPKSPIAEMIASVAEFSSIQIPELTKTIASVVELNSFQTPEVTVIASTPSVHETRPSTSQTYSPRRRTKRMRTRGMVVSGDKTQGLITAQKDTAAGLHSIAIQIAEMNALKRQKNAILERGVKLLENVCKRFCPDE